MTSGLKCYDIMVVAQYGTYITMTVILFSISLCHNPNPTWIMREKRNSTLIERNIILWIWTYFFGYWGIQPKSMFVTWIKAIFNFWIIKEFELFIPECFCNKSSTSIFCIKLLKYIFCQIYIYLSDNLFGRFSLGMKY